jgi:hypothetical protein
MPEDKKDTKSNVESISLQEKRLQRFYYDTKDVEELFDIDISENKKTVKKVYKSTKKIN